MPRRNALRRAQRAVAARQITTDDGEVKAPASTSDVLALRFIPNKIALPADPTAREALAQGCWVCGSVEHKRRECPDVEHKRCFNCGKPGHPVRLCPEPMTEGGEQIKAAFAAMYERHRRERRRQ